MNKCLKLKDDLQIVLREKKSEARFLNSERRPVSVVEVDGCEITGDEERCDYLVLLDSSAWYVELKGSDIEKALRQIGNSERLLRNRYPATDKHIVIVCSRVPAISGFQKVAKRVVGQIPGCSSRITLKSRKAKIEIS